MRICKWLTVTALCLATQQGAAQAPAATPIIPIETMFKTPAYRGLTLSPNGKYMAATVQFNDRQNLVVLDIEKKSAYALTAFKEADVRSFRWANDDRIVFTTGDEQGKEFRGDGGLFGVDRDGKNLRTLVEPFFGGHRFKFVWRETTLLGRVPDSPDEMFVMANDRAADSQDVYRIDVRSAGRRGSILVNVASGGKTLVSVSSPGKVIRWVLDSKSVPRAALSMDAERKRWWTSYQAPGSTDWKVLAEWDEGLRNVVIPVAFDPANPRNLYVASNVGRDTLAFFRFDLEAGKLGELVAGTDRYDMSSFLLIGSPLGEGGSLIFDGSDDTPGKLIGLRLFADKQTTVWFDERAQRLQAAIDAALPGRVNLFDPRLKRSLVRSYSATDPGAWYFFEPETRKLEDSGIRARPWIDPKQMGPVSYVTYTARDGMKVGAYLTVPVGFTKASPPPFVVLPHGGPWAKDNWEFDAEAQFLANRGYAVLQPNFRGSTGYGAQHLRASYKQWGGTMTDDIIDGVEWAIREGYADKNRVGVYGASYGGFATLSVMVKRPDLFKWGVNYVGVTDMIVHQDTQPAQRRGNFAPLAKALNGDQRDDAALFLAQSPARQVEKFAASVFHAYGGEDQNVDFANGRAIRAAFDKAGKPYEWMFVADEAHGYREMPNVVAFYTRFETFIKANTPAAVK